MNDPLIPCVLPRLALHPAPSAERSVARLLRFEQILGAIEAECAFATDHPDIALLAVLRIAGVARTAIAETG